MRDRALELLAEVGLSDRADYRVIDLSGGQQQRVAVARALVMDPPLVLADEPTGNLDSASGRGVVGLFDELHDSGQTIVMITHDMGLAGLANRVVQIRDGEIVEDLEAAA
jgi:putative ABC transport system ATP-binding protein